MRRYRDFSGCEDAVQEALIAAATQWPDAGVPESPAGWLVHVASRRITDQLRAEAARRVRERLVVSLVPMEDQIALAADEAPRPIDDTLELLFLCCHPALTPSAQIALTLRAVGGLTTQEIAHAFLVPEATMAQRLVRAKQTLRERGISAVELGPAERAARLRAVAHVLYLVFNEGYTASSGDALTRPDLAAEAIRLTRILASITPEPEVLGLLALMLLTDARRDARTGPAGDLIPLDEQDRSRWDREKMKEGNTFLMTALSHGETGPFQIQAAIAALHDEAAGTETTDWAQIAELYSVLLAFHDSPLVRLARAIARAMVDGPTAGLRELDGFSKDARARCQHRFDAARGHLLERAGEVARAVDAYRAAARATSNTAERNYLMLRASKLERDITDKRPL